MISRPVGAGSPARVELIAVPGLPEVTAGADLAGLVVAALSGSGIGVEDGDVLALTSKVVAKSEGRYLDPVPGQAGHEGAVATETLRVVAQRRTPRGLARIVHSRSGPVQAAAGVDASNLPTAPDGAPRLLALPLDPDASARRLRTAVGALTGARVGVLVTDTLGRPWRVGQTDAAIGAAGVVVAQDLSGRPDAHGRLMEVTLRALADEIAAAGDLVKGKTDGVPVALVRGLGHLVTDQDGAGAAALLRPWAEDWFRYGHAEAARAALGVPPEALDAAGVPAQPITPGTDRERLERAVAVACAATDPIARAADARLGVDLHPDPATVSIRCAPTPSGWLAAGALAQRIVVAAWAEDLAVDVQAPLPDGSLTISGTRGPP